VRTDSSFAVTTHQPIATLNFHLNASTTNQIKQDEKESARGGDNHHLDLSYTHVRKGTSDCLAKENNNKNNNSNNKKSATMITSTPYGRALVAAVTTNSKRKMTTRGATCEDNAPFASRSWCQNNKNNKSPPRTDYASSSMPISTSTSPEQHAGYLFNLRHFPIRRTSFDLGAMLDGETIVDDDWGFSKNFLSPGHQEQE
jgi:hypothetical protein